MLQFVVHNKKFLYHTVFQAISESPKCHNLLEKRHGILLYIHVATSRNKNIDTIILFASRNGFAI